MEKKIIIVPAVEFNVTKITIKNKTYCAPNGSSVPVDKKKKKMDIKICP